MIATALVFACSMFLLNLFRDRPGAPLRRIAAFLAAAADTMDLIPHYRREVWRGLAEMARYLMRQWRHYDLASREAAR